MRIAAAATVVVALYSGASLLAHEGHSHAWTSPGPFSAWDIAVLVLLVASATMYSLGARRMIQRGAVQPARERIAFACGWLALVAAVLPPLDALAVELFSMHMIQHELMMLVGAPLVMLGRPISTCLWAFRADWRHAAGSFLRASSANATRHLFTAPVVAWALHGIVLWVWHIPRFYDAAVQTEGIHAVQHAMFVGTSALFWWGLLYGRYGRAGYGAAVFYVFTTVIHTGLLGAVLTFAGVPLYSSYLASSAARGVDALGDQQLAGLIMWVPAGVVLTLLGIGLFAAWIGEAERRARSVRL